MDFGEYCFIKWKFNLWKFLSEIQDLVFSIGRSLCSIDQSDEENSSRVSTWFDRCLIPVWWIEKYFRSMLDSSQSIKTRETKFPAEFSSNCSECLKKCQASWTVLCNILTLHTCLLMKYKPMSINRGLCSLKTYHFYPKS